MKRGARDGKTGTGFTAEIAEDAEAIGIRTVRKQPKPMECGSP